MNTMALASVALSALQKRALFARYGGQWSGPDLSYGTVADYCDSADHLPFLAHLQGDLKDLQRPAALKALLRLVPVGSSLLEIGAGEPHVAHVLVQLGYKVTVVDPYDGSGNGPMEFERYRTDYPEVRLVRALFSRQLSELEPERFDCIYSISVLEHVHQPALGEVFEGIRHFLKPGGYSIHLVDHVLKGELSDFHLHQLAHITSLQSELAQQSTAQSVFEAVSALNAVSADPDTYYLSAEGHNHWRGQTPYETFRFRQVISLQTCKRFVPGSGLAANGFSPGDRATVQQQPR